MSSAIVNRVIFAPRLARQYATFTAFPPFTSTVGIPRILPPPNLALSAKALKNSFFEFNFIRRSTKKSDITTIEFI
jgi:hypothetical protein